jgi:hypothetical protein
MVKDSDALTNYKEPTGDDETWVPEEQLEALTMERQMNPSEDEVALAERIFRENLPVAAQAICHLARTATSQNMRMAAAKYVVERNLGRVVDPSSLPTKGEDPWDKLLAGTISNTVEEAEVHANASTNKGGAE